MNMHYADLGQIGLHYSDIGDKEAPCVVFAIAWNDLRFGTRSFHSFPMG